MEQLKYICRHYQRPPAATKEEACEPKIAHWCNNGCQGPMTLEEYNQMIVAQNKAADPSGHERPRTNQKLAEAVSEYKQTKKLPPENPRRIIPLKCKTKGCEKRRWSKTEGLCQSCYRKKYPPRHSKPKDKGDYSASFTKLNDIIEKKGPELTKLATTMRQLECHIDALKTTLVIFEEEQRKSTRVDN